jgi:hypothetical protein
MPRIQRPPPTRNAVPQRPSSPSAPSPPFSDPPSKTTTDAQTSRGDCAPQRNAKTMPARKARQTLPEQTTAFATRLPPPAGTIPLASPQYGKFASAAVGVPARRTSRTEQNSQACSCRDCSSGAHRCKAKEKCHSPAGGSAGLWPVAENYSPTVITWYDGYEWL